MKADKKEYNTGQQRLMWQLKDGGGNLLLVDEAFQPLFAPLCDAHKDGKDCSNCSEGQTLDGTFPFYHFDNLAEVCSSVR